jgi:MFS family permease
MAGAAQSAPQRRDGMGSSLSMLHAFGRRAREAVSALRGAFANPLLRRLELAAIGSVTGEGLYALAVAVFAYQSGGAPAVGAVFLLQTLVAAAAQPFTAVLGDRFRRERVMLATELARIVLIGALAVASFAELPDATLFLLAALTSAVSTAFWPAQAALLPTLVRRPEELTAANVAASTIESGGMFAGPALGALLLVATGVDTVFVAAVVAFAWSALLLTTLRPERPSEEEEEAADATGLVRTVFAGFATIARERSVRLLVALFGAQMAVAGALNVLVVVTALDLLELGESAVGRLNAAIGLGGLAGVAASLALVGYRRLASPFVVGIILWGIPIGLIALWPNQATAIALLALAGVGNTLVDVAGFTLLQRTVADAVLARVFGTLETVVLAMTGLGAIVAPLLIAAFGVRGAMLATGAFLPVLAALTWHRVRTIDAAAVVPEREIDLLAQLPFFAPLPGVVIERLASRLWERRVPEGQDVFRQGAFGDAFYVIARGRAEVFIDERRVNDLGPGDYFGEIALLRDVPRTATVRARTDLELYALEGGDFVAAVTGHATSAAQADLVVTARLASRPRGPFRIR